MFLGIIPAGSYGYLGQRGSNNFLSFLDSGWHLISPLHHVIGHIARENIVGNCTTTRMSNGHELEVSWNVVYGFDKDKIPLRLREVAARRLVQGDGNFIVQARLANALQQYVQSADPDTLFGPMGQKLLEDCVSQATQEKIRSFGLTIFNFEIEPIALPESYRALRFEQEQLAQKRFVAMQKARLETEIEKLRAENEAHIQSLRDATRIDRERRENLNEIEKEALQRKIAQHLTSNDVQNSLLLSVGKALEDHGFPAQPYLGQASFQQWLTHLLNDASTSSNNAHNDGKYAKLTG